jgi:hypothetical protein
MDHMKAVGRYVERFNELTGQNLPVGSIYQSEGLAVHVKKRHPNEVGNLEYISDVIKSPDYVGRNPKEPNSIELVKVIENNVMVCIKLDRADDYLFVASVFNITDSKLENRLKSGRLKAY